MKKIISLLVGIPMLAYGLYLSLMSHDAFLILNGAGLVAVGLDFLFSSSAGELLSAGGVVIISLIVQKVVATYLPGFRDSINMEDVNELYIFISSAIVAFLVMLVTIRIVVAIRGRHRR